MTHQFTNKMGERYLFVEVPEGSWNYTFVNNELWGVPTGGMSVRRKIETLPPGSYSIISTSRDITEEQAREIVDRKKSKYVCYYDKQIQSLNARASFQSILTHFNINHCLILKVNQDATTN